MSQPDALNQAIAAHQSGNLAEAEKLYRAILQNNPDHADACALLGVVLGSCGKHEEAIEWAAKAVVLDPHSGLLHFHQGTILMNAQKLPEAVTALARAAMLQPDNAQFRFNYANALRASNDWPTALMEYRAALRLNPQFLEACNNLALSLVHEQDYAEARDLATRAITLNPDCADGWLTLCNIAEKLKDYPAALQAGLRATALQPQNHYTWFGLGVALNRLYRDEEAIEAYQKALTLKPTRADIWDNLAQSYQSLNRLDEAHAAFRKTIEVAGQIIADEDARTEDGRAVDEKEYGNRHWHLALIELLRGDYKRGFARYRARVKEIKELKRLPLPFPLWKGENLQGKTLLVCDEQGFGDTLMMARFLPLLRAQGARVIFLVHKALEPYLREWQGADEVLIHNSKLPPCDYFCSSFDLPHRLGVTLDTLPNATPYLPLLPPDENTALPTSGFKIGIVWGGSPLHLGDAKRSIPLAIFAELFMVKSAIFYNFNRDLKAGDAELLPAYAIDNLVPRIQNFADAARLINQMDLIITCDTATAHLAGGMGKKTWVLLPFAPDWRWLTGRADTPWYPTMRLFRQPKPNDWASAIQNVKTELNHLSD